MIGDRLGQSGRRRKRAEETWRGNREKSHGAYKASRPVGMEVVKLLGMFVNYNSQ